MGSNIIKVTSFEQWREEFAKAGDKVIVVDFTAAWCGPCRFISPYFEQYSVKYEAIFLKVDVDEVQEVGQECEIRAMPTFQCYKNGKKIKEMVGANKEKLKQTIEDALAM